MAENYQPDLLSVVVDQQEFSLLAALATATFDVDQIRAEMPELFSELEALEIIDNDGLSGPVSKIFDGLRTASHMVQLNVITSDVIRQVQALIGPDDSTFMMNEGGLFRVYHRSRPEVPQEFAHLLQLLGAPLNDAPSLAIPGSAIEAAFNGDLEQLNDVLSQLELEDIEIQQAIRAGRWSMRLMMVNSFVNGEPVTEDVALLFSVEDKLYSIDPTPSPHGDHQADEIAPVSVWARISKWFYVEEATEQ